MINMNDSNKMRISYLLLRLVNKFFDTDKKTRYYGTDKQIFESEIHMIKAIKENEGIHVTGLANKLGITKGAVSQIIMKLEKKDLIRKEKDVYNQSKLVLKLTSSGEIAYINHEKLHKKLDDMISEILDKVSEENIEFLKVFLMSVEDRLEGFEENCNK